MFSNKVSTSSAKFVSKPVSIMVGISIFCLFVLSSIRHNLLQSGALDLGIFDQAVYLLSQDLPPYSSLIGAGNVHILADHAAFILYPLSFLYRIHPDIHWLLLIQAIALSVGAFPVGSLARQLGLREQQAVLVSGVFLLYPLIFNVNLFDFHPEVIALPCFLWAVLWARSHKIVPFCVAVLIILSCKAVLSLTIVAMGIWLIGFESRKLLGLIAIVLGSFWFVFATQVIIPSLGVSAITRHISRYSSLGNSVSEILSNFLIKPYVFLGKIFAVDSLVYVVLLFLPLVWVLIKGWRSLDFAPLISAIPTFAMNILADAPQQRYLANEYSLPILPFLMLLVISGLDTSRINSFTHRYWNYFIIFWAVLTFLVMSRLSSFTGEYLDSLDTWQANKEAIAIIKLDKRNQGSVLTTHEIAPQLTHRPIVKLAFANSVINNFKQFDYILLNTRHPGYMSNIEYANNLVSQISQMSDFYLRYKKDHIYLFAKPRFSVITPFPVKDYSFGGVGAAPHEGISPLHPI